MVIFFENDKLVTCIEDHKKIWAAFPMLNFRGSRVLWGYVFNGTKKTRIIDFVVKFIGRWHPFFLNSYDTSSFVFVPDWWSVVSGQEGQ